MRSVFLVPRRAGFADRDALWSFCRRYWTNALSDIPIVEGFHDEGLFNRSKAINRAAAHAAATGGWDVAVVLDADVIAAPSSVVSAAALAEETGKLVVAFDVRRDLSRAGTRRILAGYRGSWDPYVERTHSGQHSGIVAIPRSLWELLGGFDEGFEGWGYEDTAFALAAETVAGPRINIPGECWHLWHAKAPEARSGSPSWTANRRRRDLYAAASGDVEATLALRQTETPAIDDTRIPRIFHRVVPERIVPRAEEFWSKLEELHTGWRFVTWRDPLDPADFPETSSVWPLCDSGAALADLVRLEVLLRDGGIFVDWDCRPLRSFEPLLALDAFAGYEDDRIVPNAVLGAKPQHPAIREALDRALDSTRAGGGTWNGGPGATTRTFVGRPDVLLLPPEAFYPVSYRSPDRDGLMAEFDPRRHPASFVLHEYWGSWLEPERRRVPEPGPFRHPAGKTNG